MRSRDIFVLQVIVALVVTAPAFSVNPPQSKNTHTLASPLLVRGPQAIPSGAVRSNYGLFTCQVGLTPGVVCYDPYQIRHAYNIDKLTNAGLNGKGRTIVIVEGFQSPNIVSELNTWDSFYGLPGLNGLGNTPDPKLGKFTQIAPDGLTAFVPGDPNMTGWAEEITVDVLWAHAVAPGANITVVLSKSDQDADILSATRYAVDNHLGDVISQSFGENESCVDSTLLAAEHQLFVEATLKHITLMASSGDFGASQMTCDGTSWVKAVSSPASDPLVTAVGGTELNAADYCLTVLGCDPTSNPAPGTYEGEIAWNEFDAFATGGGFSVLYNTPLYQLLSIPKQYLGKRGVPDVSYTAALNHGVLAYLDIPGVPVGFYLFGGTSVGSPQWSGIIAIADQKAGHSLGFVNAALYASSLVPSFYSTLLHDVTTGNNSVVELDSNNNPVSITGFSAGVNWDATTGVGSPKADQVVNFLALHTLASDGNNAIQNSSPNATGRVGNHEMENH